MNKVYHINLGGYPFTIDEDAYDMLTRYMASLEMHFGDSSDCDEIMSDIEIRMAELLKESVGESRNIVSSKDVDLAIRTMGRPDDFETVEEDGPSEPEYEYRTGRRLFRDPDNDVIGGVCAGLAAYFGIADPVWVRLLFVILAISGGAGVPAYIILWIIMPEAKTAADRLAMRGAPVNISNIAQVIEEGVDKIASKIDDWDKKGPRRKKKVQKEGKNGRIVRQEEILIKNPLPSGMFL